MYSNFCYQFEEHFHEEVTREREKNGLTLNVDLGRWTLDGKSSFLVSGDADEVPAVENPVDPGYTKIAVLLVSTWTRCQRLSVDFPRVSDPRARLRFTSQPYRWSLDHRVLAGTHGEVQIAILAKYRRYHCAKKHSRSNVTALHVIGAIVCQQ